MQIFLQSLKSLCGEMVDTIDSKSVACESMLVRARPGAPLHNILIKFKKNHV